MRLMTEMALVQTTVEFWVSDFVVLVEFDL